MLLLKSMVGEMIQHLCRGAEKKNIKNLLMRVTFWPKFETGSYLKERSANYIIVLV
jgi:hypothetical protein